VIREIAKLTALQLIAVRHQVNNRGEYSSNLYLLLDVATPSPEEGVVSPCDQGGISRRLPLVSAGDQGGISQKPEQHPVKKTQHWNKTQRTTRARADDNNNSGGHTAQTSDVVVAFSPDLIQPTFAEFPQTTTEKEPQQEQAISFVQEDPTPLDPPAPDETGASALIAVGIAPRVAQRLASRFSPVRIEEKLRYLDFLQADQPEKVQNPCGWLRRAIEEDYARPDGYRSAQEIAAEAAAFAEVEATRQRMVRENDQKIAAAQERQREEAAARLSHWQTTYGTSQQEITLWAQLIEEFRLSMPSASFNLYVADTILLSVRDGQALIGLPNPDARDWMENRFSTRIARALAIALGGQKMSVTFVDLPTER
jgi:hypothetical protein